MKFARALILSAAIAVLASCSVLTGAGTATTVAVQDGIELATSVYITHKGGGTTAGDLAVAKSVKAVAQELQGLNTGTLTVAQFNAQMATYIAKLSVTDQIIANGVLAQIDVYFASQVGAGSILNASAAAAANVVLADIIAACALYGA
jgi:hypothetical protein